MKNQNLILPVKYEANPAISHCIHVFLRKLNSLWTLRLTILQHNLSLTTLATPLQTDHLLCLAFRASDRHPHPRPSETKNPQLTHDGLQRKTVFYDRQLCYMVLTNGPWLLLMFPIELRCNAQLVGSVPWSKCSPPSLHTALFLILARNAHPFLLVPIYTKEDGRNTKMLCFDMQYKNIATFPTEKTAHNQYPGTKSHNAYPIEPEFNARRAGRKHWIPLCERESGVNLRTLYCEPASRHTANVGFE